MHNIVITNNNNYHYHACYFLILISLIFVSSAFSSELNLFTSRHYPSDLILFKKFEEKTGIKVNVINAKSKF